MGAFVMNVPNSEYFFNNIAAKSSVKVGLANAIGVTSTYVKLAFDQRRRLAADDERQRRLADEVKVDYIVRIPGSIGKAAMASVVEKAKSLTVADLTTAIRVETTFIFGEGYMLNVTSMT